MEETAIILRKKVKSYGHPVLSGEDLSRYRSLSGDARLISFKRITADLQRRSGLFTGRYCSLSDFKRASYYKDRHTGKKAKK